MEQLNEGHKGRESEHRKIFKVCLTILQHYEIKGFKACTFSEGGRHHSCFPEIFSEFRKFLEAFTIESPFI